MTFNQFLNFRHNLIESQRTSRCEVKINVKEKKKLRYYIFVFKWDNYLKPRENVKA